MMVHQLDVHGASACTGATQAAASVHKSWHHIMQAHDTDQAWQQQEQQQLSRQPPWHRSHSWQERPAVVQPSEAMRSHALRVDDDYAKVKGKAFDFLAPVKQATPRRALVTFIEDDGCASIASAVLALAEMLLRTIYKRHNLQAA